MPNIQQQFKEQRLFGEELDRRLKELEESSEEKKPIIEPEKPFEDIPFDPMRKIDKLTLGNIDGITNLKYYQSSAQTVATATLTRVNLQTKVWDSLSEFDNTTNYRFTCVKPGKYLVIGSTASSAIGDEKRFDSRITVNGSAVQYQILDAASNVPQYRNTLAIIDLAVGDYVELYTYHTKGSDVVLLTGEAACNLMIQQIA